MTAIPLSLYIHFPWCVRKCPYCDFNSHGLSGYQPLPLVAHQSLQDIPPELEAGYIDALINDLQTSLPFIWQRPIVSVFMGGGTPSLFGDQSIDRLLTAVRTLLPLRPEAEITLEANPGTFEQARFAGFAAAGVNRLSLGGQSLNDTNLKALGRIHGADEVRRAVDAAAKIFPRVNLDWMFGLPQQTLATMRNELQEVLALPVTHVSLYQLTLEANTAFAAHPPADLPDADTLADMAVLVSEQAERFGFERYEVSAYSKTPSQRSVHNTNYWQFGDYLGIGAGAHSKLSFFKDSSHKNTEKLSGVSVIQGRHDNPIEIKRFSHPSRPKDYMDKALVATPSSTVPEANTRVAARDLPFEFMLNALRLKDGVETPLWQARTGLPLTVLQTPIQKGIARGLLDATPHRFVATPRGFDLLNTLCGLFLPPSS